MASPRTLGSAQYIYGITRPGVPLPADLTGLDDRPVGLVELGDCAAVVSDLSPNRPLGERADLMAHQGVLEALVKAGVEVLPFRFGAAMNSREAVEQELLAHNAEQLSHSLARVAGRVELRLKGTYVQEIVLREVMAEEPQIAELNRRLREIPEDAADAAYYDRIRLGELVAQALERRRERDGQVLLDALGPQAEAVVQRTPTREEDMLDASFLVERDRQPAFEQAVAALAEADGGRVRLRLIGPLPPYDFVPE